MKLSRTIGSPLAKALLGTLPVLLLLLAIWHQAELYYGRQLILDAREKLENDLIPIGNSLTATISRNFALTASLTAFVEAHPDFSILRQHYFLFAEGLLAGKHSIRVIQIFVKDHPVIYFPLDSQEVVPGWKMEDLLGEEKPEVRQDILRTVSGRSVTVSSPYELRQGGLGVAVREAIFIKEELQSIVMVILDLSKLIGNSGLSRLNTGLNLALRDKAGRVFWGDEEIFRGDPVFYSIQLPDGAWELGAVPADGWPATVVKELYRFRFIGLILVALGTVLGFVIVKRLLFLGATVTRERIRRREAEEWQYIAVRAANIGLWDWDFESNKVIYSPEWKRHIGYGENEISDHFSEWENHVHPDDLDRCLDTVKAFIAAPWPNYQLEFRFRHKNGSYRWIMATASLLHDLDGRPIRMIGSHVDITDLKNSAEALRKSEESFRYVLESMHLIGIMLDREGNLNFCNDYLLNLTGWKRAEVLGKSWFDCFLPPEIRDQTKKSVFTRIIETGEYPDYYQNEIITRSGERRLISWDNTVYWDNDRRVESVTCLGVDITEAKRAETEIVKSATSLAQAQSIAKLGSWEFDPASGAGSWSAEMFRLTGFEENKGVPPFSALLEIVHPDDRALFSSIRGQVLQTNESVSFEFRGNPADGQCRYFAAKINPVTDTAGRPIKWTGTLQDITEQKKVELELLDLKDQLEQRVADRTARLETINKELDSFTYTVSHDLKAPLRGIDGYSRLLEEDHAENIDEEGRQFVRNIRQAVSRMNQLIDDLLAYSRLDRRSWQKTVFDPVSLISSLLEEWSDEIAKRNITLELDLECELVHADVDGLQIILRNLLDNAIKFTTNTDRPRIELGGRVYDSYCLLWVRDNGIGFDMKFCERIFDIFQRLQPDEDIPGTGVGLAIARKATKRMGGRIWGESSPGIGTTFYLELPRSS